MKALTPPKTPHPAVSQELAVRLAEHGLHVRGALSPNTERALRADVTVFTSWCENHGCASLPADATTVAAFVDAMAESRKPATVRRYVSSVAAYHRAAGLETPTRAEPVRLALKRLVRSKGTRQAQAQALTRGAVDCMLTACGMGLNADRDRALLAVGYDSLVRRSELVALNVDDVTFAKNGSASVLVRRSKSDQDGAGSMRYLHSDTARELRRWLDSAKITSGPLFRRVRRGGVVEATRLDAGSVARIFRRMAERAGLDANGISGHSLRVGAAQDMVGAGYEMPAIMQAGGWKSATMPSRYAENLLAARSASARLAREQGRS